MATQTTNLNLSKAEQTDAILDTLRANNSNFDTLDTKITEIENQLDDAELPIASATTLGGIKVGQNLTITEDGVLNAPDGSGGGSGGVTILEATIPTTGWISFTDGGGYVTIANGNITADDVPIITPVLGSGSSGKSLLEEWNKIGRIEAREGYLYVYAYEEIPTTEIPIQIVCLR